MRCQVSMCHLERLLMIDYSRYEPKEPLEGYWLCRECGKNLNYAMQIWGVPDRGCDWCHIHGVQIMLYNKPLRPKVGPEVNISVG